MISETETLPPPHWKLVAIDETEHWHLGHGMMEKIKRIWGVYLFDARRHVHCCELTPSYELYPIESVVDFVDDPPVDDQDREDIEEEVMNLSGGDPVIYVHTFAVDDNITNKVWRVHEFGPEDADDWQKQIADWDGEVEKAWEAQLEGMTEHCRGNQFL